MTMVLTPSKSGQGGSPIALASGYWLLVGTLVLSGSYAAGGDTVDLTPHFPAGKTVRECIILSPIRSFNATYDVVNKKIQLWGIDPAAASIQVAAAEHAAAAYDADMSVAGGIPFVALLKG